MKREMKSNGWMEEKKNAYIKVSNATEDEVDGGRVVTSEVTVVCLFARASTRDDAVRLVGLPGNSRICIRLDVSKDAKGTNAKDLLFKEAL